MLLLMVGREMRLEACVDGLGSTLERGSQNVERTISVRPTRGSASLCVSSFL